MDSFTFEKPVLENVRAFSLISSPLVHSLSVTPIIEILHLWVWFSNSVLYFFLFCRGGGEGEFPEFSNSYVQLIISAMIILLFSKSAFLFSVVVIVNSLSPCFMEVVFSSLKTTFLNTVFF